MHGHKKLKQFFLFAIIFFVVTSFQTFGYLSYSRGVLQKEILLTFREQSEALRLNFLQRIERQFALLEALAEYAAKEDDISKENFDVFREYMNLFTDYDKMYVSDIEIGTVVQETGREIAITEGNILEIEGSRTIAFLKKDDAAETLVLSVPIDRSDATKGALIAYIDGDRLFQDVDKNFFEGAGALYVVDEQGFLLGAESQDKYIHGESNVFFYLDSKKTIDIMNMQEGITEYREGDAYWFSAFVPLGMQELYIFYLVPDTITAQLQNKYGATELQHILEMILLNAGGYAAVYFFMKKTMTALEKEKNCFETAEEVAGMISFVGDYRKDSFEVNDVFFKEIGRNPIITKISDFAKPHPYIIEEDQEIFGKMGLDLIHGKETGNAQYRLLGKDGNIQ